MCVLLSICALALISLLHPHNMSHMSRAARNTSSQPPFPPPSIHLFVHILVRYNTVSSKWNTCAACYTHIAPLRVCCMLLAMLAPFWIVRCLVMIKWCRRRWDAETFAGRRAWYAKHKYYRRAEIRETIGMMRLWLRQGIGRWSGPMLYIGNIESWVGRSS